MLSSTKPVLLALLLGGCASFSTASRSGASGAGPEQVYERAKEDLDDGLYPEAVAGFTEVKTKYPYSRFAVLADLRLADSQFAQGKYLEAIDAYRMFLKYHPTHAEAAYAMLRIGESYFEQIPGDWWFMPPSSEKDQGATKNAIAAYRDMLARYPQSKEAETARTRLEEARRKLADHELYVARFYFSREHHRAAAERAEGMLRDYPGTELDEEALWVLAQARQELGENGAARTAAGKIVTEHGGGRYAEDAASLLKSLPPASPTPPVIASPEKGS